MECLMDSVLLLGVRRGTYLFDLFMLALLVDQAETVAIILQLQRIILHALNYQPFACLLLPIPLSFLLFFSSAPSEAQGDDASTSDLFQVGSALFMLF